MPLKRLIEKSFSRDFDFVRSCFVEKNGDLNHLLSIHFIIQTRVDPFDLLSRL